MEPSHFAMNTEEEDSSLGDGHSSSHATNTETTKTTQSKAVQERIAKEESTAVMKLRIIVLLLLMVAAVVVSVSIFYVTFTEDGKEFMQHYEAAANILIKSFTNVLDEDLQSIATLGVTEKDTNWPYEVLPNFAQRAANARHMSGALSVRMAPVVAKEEIEVWDQFVNDPINTKWIEETFHYQEQKGVNDVEDPDNVQKSRIESGVMVDPVHYLNETGYAVKVVEPSAYFLPVWQTNPVLKTSYINEDMLYWTNTTTDPMDEVAKIVLQDETAVLSGFVSAPAGSVRDTNPRTAMFATLQSMEREQEVEYLGDPFLYVYLPVFDVIGPEEKRVVAIMTAELNWGAILAKYLPQGINQNGITVVLSNTCSKDVNAEAESFTFEVHGAQVHPIGFGDHHDAMYDEYQITGAFETEYLYDGTVSGIQIEGGCTYKIDIYPTQAFVEGYLTSTPIVITMCTVLVFIFVTLIFLFYDRLVEQRQDSVLVKATKSHKLVAELFPEYVRERLYDEADGGEAGFKKQVQSAANVRETAIADLYLHCSVFFGDIKGFTAWSSTREPEQVFILLQSIYGAFDDLAKRRKVFKVETIGDSYMAVTGLPDPMENHAVTMVRFAADCLVKMKKVVKELESSLGPDTGNLSMRIGIHSGQVTAGVLRGERARFQLFGDTVNTASRMESTGQAGRIQISEATAVILRKKGKEQWLKPREEGIDAKGKGRLSTFWVCPSRQSGSSTTSADSSQSDDASVQASDCASGKTEEAQSKPTVNPRLVTWVVKLLVEDIKKIVHARENSGVSKKGDKDIVYHKPEGACPLDEVKEVIEMPEFCAGRVCIGDSCKHKEVVVGSAIENDLTRYVHEIAGRYENNHFHNFNHACHVTMSVNKLLKRVVAVKHDEMTDTEAEHARVALRLHNNTYGIKSDPLAFLAMSFSALIHDVDHKGVSNGQLGKEQPALDERYAGNSLAEQNSLDIAWEILMRDEYARLRSFIFHTQDELLRFRQLVVNIVLATDIFDAKMNQCRKARWTKAFGRSNSGSSGDLQLLEKEAETDSDPNMRATIIMEHIIQASDVSHTMQHWHVYQKWNKDLFREMHAAYKAGRMPKNPADFWVQGELGFFDNYIIPLAKKLETCGVFGVSPDELLYHARQNRNEWKEKGQSIVEELVKEVEGKSRKQHAVAAAK